MPVQQILQTSGVTHFRLAVWVIAVLVLSSFIPSVVPSTAFSAPFSELIQFTQPDGSLLILKGDGDEFHADFETTAGYTVVFNSDNRAYYFARLSSDGKRLEPTEILAHLAPPENILRHIRSDKKSVTDAARDRRKQWEAETGLEERWKQMKLLALAGESAGSPSASELFSPPTSPTIGDKVGLTLLIDFPDAPETVSKESIEDFLNGDSYTGNGNNGSIKEYFRDVSNGLLNYTNVVTIYIRMQQPKSYYNDTTKDSGTQGRLLIKDALNLLKARADYNSSILPTFDPLTVDGSSRVIALNVLFAGSNSGVWSKGLWPSSSSLSNSISLGNGKSVYRYQITNIGSYPTIGTFSHENGHMLCGFPDLYDYGSDSKGGAGYFSLMGYGNNLGSGKNPSQVDAYLKVAAGWANVIDINGTSNLAASLIAAPNIGFNVFYRFRKPGVSTEYFLVENRQKYGRDLNLPSAGIAVWHVDQLGNRDNQSLVPNSTHQNYELTLVQADNLWHFQGNVNSGDVNDLFYLGNKAVGYTNRLDDSSSPNGNWWDGAPSHINLNGFSLNGMTMTFTIGDPISVPSAPVITSVHAGNSQAAVYFSPPGSDGGGSITGYSVYSSSGDVVLSDSVPAIVSGLINGNSYTFTVKAINEAGQGPASIVSASITPGIAVLSGNDAVGYQTLQAAYEAATDGQTIKVLDDATFDDFAVTSASSKGSVSVVGGYDDAFTQPAGQPARIGRITLSAGTTRFQNIVVRSP